MRYDQRLQVFVAIARLLKMGIVVRGRV